MKKRLFAMLLTGSLAASSLLGCSGNPAPSTTAAADTTAAGSQAGQETSQEKTDTTAASGEKTVIELFHQKPENVELYNQLTAKFMDENPDIQVNVTLAETTTTTIISRIAAGNIPELVSVFPWSASYQDMMREGVFKDLTDEEFMKRVNPSVLERCKVEGKYYSLPLTMNAYGLYYNVDLFKELGLEVPKTEEELWTVCEALKEKGIQAFSFPDKKATRISQMFDRMLIGCIDHDFYSKCDQLAAGTYKITEDENIRKYAETILKLREYGNADSLGYDDEPAYEEFTSGKAAMYIDGSWAVPTFETMNPDLNFDCTAIPPITTDEFYTAGTVDTAFSISSDCTDAEYDACIRFLNYLVREDIAQEFSDMDKNPTLVNGVEYSVPQLVEINSYIESGKFGPSLASIWTQDLRNGLNVSVQALILDKDVDTFLEEFQAIVEEYYVPQK
ncbi:extracellular solute-binding protein [Clostridium sp. MCC353]|uniref:ABC transporter substrate-binding protein n=1 Tax=Clostridium sp. MCC353 TaxID=2592646 RepID=UPI001C035154|nr:extracellular solute-binding protein [Clostridium sp. MCC353]